MRRVMLLALLALPLPALAQSAPSGTQLTVSAEVQVQGTPDMATLSTGVLTMAATAAEATKGNAAKMAAIFAALEKAGVAKKDMQTSNFSLQPQFAYEAEKAPQLTGYQVSNQLSVVVRKLDTLGTVMDALVSVGSNQINGPTFGIENPEPLLDSARKQAVALATQRAQLYASAAGLKVGRIVSLSEGSAMDDPGPRPMMMKAMAAEAAIPVAEGQVDLSVSLNAVFELVP